MKSSTKILARAGLIACLYVVLSLLVFPLASGAVQLRVSEILTLLPLLYLEAVPALFVGCFLSNLITGCAIFDVVLGSLITLVAGALTYLTAMLIKNKWLKIAVGGAFPVLLNAFLLPLVWLLCYGTGEYVYIVQALIVLAGQSLAVYLLGTPSFIAIERLKNNGVNFLN